MRGRRRREFSESEEAWRSASEDSHVPKASAVLAAERGGTLLP